MSSQNQINIYIDKLTKSIENSITGDCFHTEVIPLAKKDLYLLKSADWDFDWQFEFQQKEKMVFKLVISQNPNVIQGLISLQDKADHIYMHLIESNKFNRGSKKVYLGVAGNLIAYACKLSFEKGYDGYISFESKTKLINHYKATLGAQQLFGNIMVIEKASALKLVGQYFKNI